jgi:glycosyltransferase involved in cell wall biosynthesis
VVWNDKSIDLCYIGGIAELRGIFEMISLIQGTDLKLSLSGLFENDALFTTIKSLDGWKNVSYNGYVSRNVAKQILRDSKIGLLILHPTQTHLDALPIKLFEYMAAGLPIIASDFQNWKEIIEGNNCGYCIDPFDKKMQLEKIEFLINNPFIAQQMGRNGTIAVKEKFNWDVEAKKLVDLYLKLSN